MSFRSDHYVFLAKRENQYCSLSPCLSCILADNAEESQRGAFAHRR
jgi:hypothetical protein